MGPVKIILIARGEKAQHPAAMRQDQNPCAIGGFEYLGWLADLLKNFNQFSHILGRKFLVPWTRPRAANVFQRPGTGLRHHFDTEDECTNADECEHPERPRSGS